MKVKKNLKRSIPAVVTAAVIVCGTALVPAQTVQAEEGFPGMFHEEGGFYQEYSYEDTVEEYSYYEDAAYYTDTTVYSTDETSTDETSTTADSTDGTVTAVYSTDAAEDSDSVNGVPYYNQGDYSYVPYNTGSVASDGCGITAFAMAASYCTGETITPEDAAIWGMANGANTVTSWEAFAVLADHYGVNLTGQYTGPLYGGSSDEIISALENGYVVIGSMTGGYFNPYGGGHYILYSGITEEGTIYVSDPGSRDRTFAGTYDPSDAFSCCKQYWIFAPDTEES